MIYFSLFFFNAWNNSQHLLSVIKNFDMDLMEWPMVPVEKVGPWYGFGGVVYGLSRRYFFFFYFILNNKNLLI